MATSDPALHGQSHFANARNRPVCRSRSLIPTIKNVAEADHGNWATLSATGSEQG